MAEAVPVYAFRRLARGDLPLVARWLKEPHVARWWGNAGEELQNIEEHLTSATVEPYLILMDDKPIGYLQSYDVHGEGDHPYADMPKGAIGIDLSIGEPSLVGRGHGPRLIEAFVQELFQKGVECVVIDPDPDNAQAIRAYEKAGFHAVDRRTSIYGPALLMRRDAKEPLP